MEAAEQRRDQEPRQDKLPDPAVWARLVTAVREILGDIDTVVGDTFVQLGHQPTGISVTYSVDEVEMSVPYWTRDDAARQIVEVIYRLAVDVERETGSRGYDPQMDCSTADAAIDIDLVFQTFSTGAGLFRRRARADRIELPS